MFSTIKGMLFGTGKKTRIIDELQLEIVHKLPGETEDNKIYLMETSLFENISQYFHLSKKVVFSGWGDPLDHPQFTHMLAETAQKVKFIDINTGITNLDSDILKKILDANVNCLKISLSSPEDNLDALKELKELKTNGSPKIILHYTMTTECLPRLPEIVAMAGDLKIDEVTAGNIDFIFSEELNRSKVFEGNISDEYRGDLIKQKEIRAKKEYEDIVEEAKKIADKKRIYFDPKPLVATEAVMCEYSPLKNAFIAWNGELAPCPLLCLKDMKLYFNNDAFEFTPFIVGNIGSEGLSELWNKEKYVQFRDIFAKRVDIFNRYMEETFEDEPNAKLILNNYKKLEEQLDDNKLPFVCSKCYKAYGI